MDALLPGLVKTARTIAMQSNPGSVPNMSPEEEREFDEYLLNTTKGIFSGGGGGLFDMLGAAAGAGGGGAGEGAGGLESLLGGLSGLGGGGGGGSAERVNAKFDIHEDVSVDMPDFFNNKVFTVRFHAKVFDPELNAMKKKKKKIDVTLPAGSPDNFVMHVPGQGHYDGITKTTGSLYIHFNYVADSQWKSIYRRQGQTLVMSIPMESFREDGFAFRRTLPHPSGKSIRVNVSPSILENAPLGIGGRSVITIPGFGFPRCGSTPAGALQIRVFFDPEKMDYVSGGDFMIQSRYALSASMEMFANLNGAQTVQLNITNPSWVHSIASSGPETSSAAVAAAAPNAVEEESDEDESSPSITEEVSDAEEETVVEGLD